MFVNLSYFCKYRFWFWFTHDFSLNFLPRLIKLKTKKITVSAKVFTWGSSKHTRNETEKNRVCARRSGWINTERRGVKSVVNDLKRYHLVLYIQKSEPIFIGVNNAEISCNESLNYSLYCRVKCSLIAHAKLLHHIESTKVDRMKNARTKIHRV